MPTLVGVTRFIPSEYSTEIPVQMHSDAVDGDLALFVASADANKVITFPAGFSVIYEGAVPNSPYGDTRIGVAYRIHPTSTPTTYTATITEADAASGSISVWRGVDPDTPLDVTFERAASDGSSQEDIPPCPSLTTVTDGATLINVVTAGGALPFSTIDDENCYDPPAEITELIEANTAAGSSYAGHAVGYEQLGAAGATAAHAWSTQIGDHGGTAISIALRVDPNADQGPWDSSEGARVVDAATGKSDGSGTVAVTYPGSIAADDVAIAVIAASSGSVSLPAGFTEIGANAGEEMEDFIRGFTGENASPISFTQSWNRIFGGLRYGFMYAPAPTVDGKQALYQDEAGTAPATADGDPVRYLVDLSGNGLHAIQPDTESAGLTLRGSEGDWRIECDVSLNRPRIPVSQMSVPMSNDEFTGFSLTLGWDDSLQPDADGDKKRVLLSTVGSTSRFMYVAYDGSTSDVINGRTDWDILRTDKTLVDPTPTERDELWTELENSKTFTFGEWSFNDVSWTEDDWYLLGYEGGWEASGDFYGLVCAEIDPFTELFPAVKMGYQVLAGSEVDEDFTHDISEDAVASLIIVRDADITDILDVGITYHARKSGQDDVDDLEDRWAAGTTPETHNTLLLNIVTGGWDTSTHTRPGDMAKDVDTSISSLTDGVALAIGHRPLGSTSWHTPTRWAADTGQTTSSPYQTFTLALKSAEEGLYAKITSTSEVRADRPELNLSLDGEVTASATLTAGELSAKSPLAVGTSLLGTSSITAAEPASALPLEGDVAGAATVDIGQIIALRPLSAEGMAARGAVSADLNAVQPFDDAPTLAGTASMFASLGRSVSTGSAQLTGRASVEAGELIATKGLFSDIKGTGQVTAALNVGAVISDADLLGRAYYRRARMPRGVLALSGGHVTTTASVTGSLLSSSDMMAKIRGKAVIRTEPLSFNSELSAEALAMALANALDQYSVPALNERTTKPLKLNRTVKL